MKRKKTDNLDKSLNRSSIEQYRRAKISSVVRKIISQPLTRGQYTNHKDALGLKDRLSQIRRKIRRSTSQ
jgi:hypothetical protein